MENAVCMKSYEIFTFFHLNIQSFKSCKVFFTIVFHFNHQRLGLNVVHLNRYKQ
jgi:hypothetical protein